MTTADKAFDMAIRMFKSIAIEYHKFILSKLSKNLRSMPMPNETDIISNDGYEIVQRKIISRPSASGQIYVFKVGGLDNGKPVSAIKVGRSVKYETRLNTYTFGPEVISIYEVSNMLKAERVALDYAISLEYKRYRKEYFDVPEHLINDFNEGIKNKISEYLILDEPAEPAEHAEPIISAEPIVSDNVALVQ